MYKDALRAFVRGYRRNMAAPTETELTQVQKTPDRLLRIEEIIDGEQPLIPLSRTGFYDAIRRGDLPKPKKIGRTSVWPESELQAAIAALPIDSTKAGT